MSKVQLTRQALQFETSTSWKHLGLIALATDLTSERDFMRILPADLAGLYTTRVAFENPTTPENLLQMQPLISAATALILPDERLDAICYSCTAASVVIGDDAVADAIHQIRPGVPVVTPSASARLAFKALQVNRIAIITPYLVETSKPMAEYFLTHGLQVIRLDCFGLEDDREMARVSRSSIIEAACNIDQPNVEAIFISCTALPAMSAIAEIEARTGKPVVTSNQASAWALINHAGLDYRPRGYGRLFDLNLPGAETH